MIKRFLHPRSLRRYAFLIIFVLIVYSITTASSRSQFKLETGLGPNVSGRRRANALSAFSWIDNRRKHTLELVNGSKNSRSPFDLLPWGKEDNKVSEEEQNLLVKLEDAPLDMKCRYMIDAIYVAHKGWNNQQMTKYHSSEEANDMLASLLGERVRLFDHCFISGGLKVKDVMNMDSLVSEDKLGSPEDFIERMFPFLQQGNLVWPKMYDLRRGKELKMPAVAQDTYANFWNNWIKLSKGKGIAATFNPTELTLFHRQLRVLSKLNNTLPIQVVTSGFEFTRAQVDQLSQYARDTDQEVTLIDCSTILIKEFTQNNVEKFVNKWLAALFNTFEEVLLLDVDTVPFVDVEEFFKEPQYRATGMALFKDRAMMDEHTYGYCLETLAGLEPSHEENKLMGTKLLFESTQKELPQTEAASVYRRFFHDGVLHHVDSGLVPVNKVKNFGGLLFSFMINLDTKIQGCVHGDKEFFWLGQLYAGKNYAIYPQDAGVIGLIEDKPMEALTQTSYTICGSQLAHTFYSLTKEAHQLVWTNGGLSTCKVPHGAEMDFQRLPDYFMARYGDVETTKRVYAAPLHIQAMIIPDSEKSTWLQLRECGDSAFCASAVEDTADGRNSVSTLIQFTPEEQDFLDSISFAWNGRTFIDG
ncbi:hypothetical protein ZYGR_0Z01640 [Zygosaccharomyces rouxii]|uniref:Alpha-1,3-mannosyltransferase MNT3 n=1 Tax=Zygosaccharomyces rouxii TaxID=4956 RepID=A0A1Q3A519_ZYGRO|nr:hypothetical protein ZYGR_0Z01640 [Zygosaccharomyces rouxii]